MTKHYDAIIIGAGVTGLYSLYRLRELGLSARAFDDGGGVGAGSGRLRRRRWR